MSRAYIVRMPTPPNPKPNAKPSRYKVSPETSAKLSAAGRKGRVRLHTRDEGVDLKERFIEALKEHKSVGNACTALGYSRRHLYRLRSEDPDFREKWDEAWDIVVDQLEASMMDHSINGYAEPVFHQGEEVGSKQRYETSERIFMLKKNRPEKYDDKLQINVSASEYAEQVRNALAAQDEEAKRAAAEGETPPKSA